ncbi:hypothetical protein FIM02_02170 [SAR202 cluster bacterium AD-802-E10_MRT_200m]|nr:hypothetical protein [SAR202 cluster bacterium AD-802-E10_MRT_200m]
MGKVQRIEPIQIFHVFCEVIGEKILITIPQILELGKINTTNSWRESSWFTLIKRPIVLASTNKTKIKLLTWVIYGLDLYPVLPIDFPTGPNAQETGSTHRQNAEIKANTWSQATNFLSLATDGGLCIPSLGSKWQSINTKRFAGPDATDKQRVNHLLNLIKLHSPKNRQAYWIEALSVSWKGQPLATWEVHGELGTLGIRPIKGSSVGEFWVDTLWRPFKQQSGMTHQSSQIETISSHWGQLKNNFQAFYQSMPRLLEEK